MQTFYLRFADEAAAIVALAAYRSTDEASQAVWLTASHTHALDVVGTLHKPTGALIDDGQGVQMQEMAVLPGFHVNLMVAALPAELLPYVVIPVTPLRVFG